MTSRQVTTIRNALAAVFGECSLRIHEDDLEVYFEARGCSVRIGQEPVELDSINGTTTVSGFRVGNYNWDGEFVEVLTTAELWPAIHAAQRVVAEGILSNFRWDEYAEEFRQYE